MLQSAWRRSPSRRQLLREQQLRQNRRESVTSPVAPVEESASASKAASSMTPTAGAEKKSSSGLQHLMSNEQLLKGAETLGAIYAVWSAFTSLLTAEATHHAMRRVVGQALLAPAVATLAAFNRGWRAIVTTAPAPSSTSSSLSPPPRIRMGDPPGLASFDCAPTFNRDMAVAVRRIAGTVRARESSLSAVRAAAKRLIYGDIGNGDRGGGGDPGSGVEEKEGREEEEEVEAIKAAGAEAVSLVSEVAEVCVVRESRPCPCHFHRVATFFSAPNSFVPRCAVGMWQHSGSLPHKQPDVDS